MNTELLCLDWPKCVSSINQATQLAVDVEGLPGEHVNKIANTIFDLAQGINENWDDLWEDGYKSISQQQADVLVACREIQKAVKHLIDIFRFRQSHENKERIEAREREAKGSKKRRRRLPPPAPRSLRMYEEEEEEPMLPSGLIDDHPKFVDVKVEPLDEEVQDALNQGSLDQGQFEGREVKEEEEEFDEFACLRQPKSNDVVNKRKVHEPVAVKRFQSTRAPPKSYAGYDEDMDDDDDDEDGDKEMEDDINNDDNDDCTPSGQPTLRSSLKAFEASGEGPSTTTIQKRAMCDVCNKFTVKYFITPKDPALSKICYTNLVGLSPKEHARVECLKLRKARATVCESHYTKDPPKTFASVPGLCGMAMPPWSVRERRAKVNELIKTKGIKTSNEHRWADNWQNNFQKSHPTKRTGLSRAAKAAPLRGPPLLRDGPIPNPTPPATYTVDRDYSEEPNPFEDEDEVF